MLALLNWRLWAALLIATGLAASHWKAYKVGQNEGVAQLNAFKSEATQRSVELMDERDAKEKQLQEDADKTRKAKNVQIASLTADLRVALDGLRDRPERPREGDLPALTATGPACTGASLFKQDAEFLVRESNRADELRANLTECQAAYGKARDALMK